MYNWNGNGTYKKTWHFSKFGICVCPEKIIFYWFFLKCFGRKTPDNKKNLLTVSFMGNQTSCTPQQIKDGKCPTVNKDGSAKATSGRCDVQASLGVQDVNILKTHQSNCTVTLPACKGLCVCVCWHNWDRHILNTNNSVICNTIQVSVLKEFRLARILIQINWWSQHCNRNQVPWIMFVLLLIVPRLLFQTLPLPAVLLSLERC